MSGICDTCSLSKGCRKPIGGVDSCRRYVRAEESNYQRLFGTPEKAARTLECSCHLLYGLKVDGFVACVGCPVYDEDADVDDCCYDALLEWLKGDA